MSASSAIISLKNGTSRLLSQVRITYFGFCFFLPSRLPRASTLCSFSSEKIAYSSLFGTKGGIKRAPQITHINCKISRCAPWMMPWWTRTCPLSVQHILIFWNQVLHLVHKGHSSVSFQAGHIVISLYHLKLLIFHPPVENGQTKCGHTHSHTYTQPKQGRRIWYMLRHAWTLKTLCYMKLSQTQKDTIVWFL